MAESKLTALSKGELKYRWQRWFAWRPVRTAWGQVLWLERVERRGGFDHRKNSDGRPPWLWEYRPSALRQQGGSEQ